MIKLKSLLKKGVFIIAEAGVNHNGSVKLALKLVDAAKEAGADAVKFQTFITEKCISKNTVLAGYQKRNAGAKKSQYEMAKELELPLESFKIIKDRCSKKGIIFLSTPDEEESLDYLCGLRMPIIKIGSGDSNNIPLIAYAAKKKRPVILSTGMCDLKDVAEAVKAVKAAGNNEIALMHCTTEYPAPFSELNLKAMATLAKKFGLPVGYSDHTAGIEASIAAVAMGAKIIEKHFTLDKNMKGPDHKASLSADELKQLVKAVRNIELSVGTGIK
ncbi:MAG: N-acetylneuraminate synthase family protein, partial [Candidatus Margulisiibacteriota bacterium]